MRTLEVSNCSSAGTNPLHNKKPKKEKKEEDEEDKAHKAKLAAGTTIAGRATYVDL